MRHEDADSAPAEGAAMYDGPSGTADIEEAMWHSERLLLQVDAGLRRISVTEALGAGLSAVVALAAVSSAVDSGGSFKAWIVALAGGGAFISLVAILTARLLVRFREQVKRDALIMDDIVSVQRELVPLIAREEKWSPARLSLLQKRLERFPIGPDAILGRPRAGSL
jgi:hypothetical protein